MRYRVLINPDIFLSAFTMEDENGERIQARSWAGAPDGSAYDTNLDAEVKSAMDTTVDHEESNNNVYPGSLGHAGIHTSQLNSIVIRRTFALKWIENQQKRYKFLPIAIDKEPNWEYLRNRIIQGPHGARQIKSAKRKKSNA